MGSELVDVRNGLFAAIDNSQCKHKSSVFGVPLTIVYPLNIHVAKGTCVLTGSDFHAAELQQVYQFGNKLRSDGAMHKHGFNSITCRWRLNLAVEDYRRSQIQIGGGIHIDVTHAVSVPEHRNACICRNEPNQLRTSARNHEIDVLVEREQSMQLFPDRTACNRR